ncbi:MAG: helix-turn-helix domain-containing protein [Bacteroidales bacterium]|nr:helix-turn-helix domain-containing protein [Bacteroidales bacterium]
MQNIIFSIPEPEFKTIIRDAVLNAIVEFAPKQQVKETTPELLTRAETAEYLGVSLPTLNDWTKHGIIKGYRIAGRVRYKRPDIENALKEIETFKNKRRV